MKEPQSAEQDTEENIKHQLTILRNGFCDGFELSRPAGLKARYKIRVHDDRVSRLLVLSCVLHYSVFVDPRKDIADVTSNPFKK